MEENNNNLVYEVGYHLLPIIEEAEIPAEASKIRSIIEKNDGIIISEDLPKMISLAYDICKDIDSKRQKFNRAYFGWIKFEAESSKIASIKKEIEEKKEILRFIIVKTVKENTLNTPKIPLFKKNVLKEEKTDIDVEKPKATEAEIDKSIDELVINETL